MLIIRSIEKMRKVCAALRRQGRTIGFVPTMGALHEGHLSLINQAGKDNDVVAVSIFVNPAQFARGEDFNKYPRDFAGDAAVCKKNGVDILFSPGSRLMYPKGFRTFIAVEELSGALCGKFRPNHFRGVATVVAKLFNIVFPSVSYFGQKDAQQAILI